MAKFKNGDRVNFSSNGCYGSVWHDSNGGKNHYSNCYGIIVDHIENNVYKVAIYNKSDNKQITFIHTEMRPWVFSENEIELLEEDKTMTIGSKLSAILLTKIKLQSATAIDEERKCNDLANKVLTMVDEIVDDLFAGRTRDSIHIIVEENSILVAKDDCSDIYSALEIVYNNDRAKEILDGKLADQGIEIYFYFERDEYTGMTKIHKL